MWTQNVVSVLWKRRDRTEVNSHSGYNFENVLQFIMLFTLDPSRQDSKRKTCCILFYFHRNFQKNVVFPKSLEVLLLFYSAMMSLKYGSENPKSISLPSGICFRNYYWGETQAGWSELVYVLIFKIAPYNYFDVVVYDMRIRFLLACR